MIIFFCTVIGVVFIQLLMRNLAPPEKKVEHLIRPKCDLSSDQFRREVGVLLGPSLTEGNGIDILDDGEEIFPAMLEAIAEAKKTITFETFIYWSGEVGKEFSEAFAEKAREGVEVKVLIDWLGSKIIGSEEESLMLEAGVDLQIYRPLSWYHLSRMNHRTHRKIMVIDGHLGFTGGVGISDQWKGDVREGEERDYWRDNHYRLRGPVVAQMQSVFINNWVKTTGHSLHGEDYFPKIVAEGCRTMQCFHSSPTEGAESVRLMFLYLIESCCESLDIAAAYFIPDPLMRKALVGARGRGVRVRVILPGRNNDVRAVTHASRELWGDLLEAGVEIYRFKPSMFHCKTLIADRKMVTLGSANFDNRSFHLNDEMNINVFDEEFGVEMSELYEKDLQETARVDYDEWKKRSRVKKLHDWYYGKFRDQL